MIDIGVWISLVALLLGLSSSVSGPPAPSGWEPPSAVAGTYEQRVHIMPADTWVCLGEEDR